MCNSRKCNKKGDINVTQVFDERLIIVLADVKDSLLFLNSLNCKKVNIHFLFIFLRE